MQFCLTSTFIACFVIQASLLLQLTTAHGNFDQPLASLSAKREFAFTGGNLWHLTVQPGVRAPGGHCWHGIAIVARKGETLVVSGKKPIGTSGRPNKNVTVTYTNCYCSEILNITTFVNGTRNPNHTFGVNIRKSNRCSFSVGIKRTDQPGAHWRENPIDLYWSVIFAKGSCGKVPCLERECAFHEKDNQPCYCIDKSKMGSRKCPAETPLNVKLHRANGSSCTNSMIITWDMPAETNNTSKFNITLRRCQPERLTLTYDSPVPLTAGNWTIPNLDPDAAYKASVRAFTVEGASPYSDLSDQFETCPLPQKPQKQVDGRKKPEKGRNVANKMKNNALWMFCFYMAAAQLNLRLTAP